MIVLLLLSINIISANLGYDNEFLPKITKDPITTGGNITYNQNITNNLNPDGNASSICAGDEVLLGNGSCQTSSDFGSGAATDLTNVALTNQSNSFGAFNQSTTGWWNGQILWSWIRNLPNIIFTIDSENNPNQILISNNTNVGVNGTGLNLSIAQYVSNLSITDTNITYYSDGDWIIKNITNGFNFNESQLSTTYYNATSVARVIGTDSGGDLADIQSYNRVTYNITEALSDFDLRVNFTGITEFTTLLVRHKTDTTGGHVSAIQIWDYSDNEWEGYGYLTESFTSDMKTLGCYDDTDHIQDGIVQVRFFQEAVGNAGHIHQFDWVSLSKGFGTPVGQEIDPKFSEWLGNPILENNLNITGYNITMGAKLTLGGAELIEDSNGDLHLW